MFLELCLCLTGAIISDADRQALETDPAWQSSRFGPLENYILDFLIGGASAGESVRLKLQTPLFVADALLDAGRQQLDDDLQAAQEVHSLHHHLALWSLKILSWYLDYSKLS